MIWYSHYCGCVQISTTSLHRYHSYHVGPCYFGRCSSHCTVSHSITYNGSFGLMMVVSYFSSNTGTFNYANYQSNTQRLSPRTPHLISQNLYAILGHHGTRFALRSFLSRASLSPPQRVTSSMSIVVPRCLRKRNVMRSGLS